MQPNTMSQLLREERAVQSMQPMQIVMRCIVLVIGVLSLLALTKIAMRMYRKEPVFQNKGGSPFSPLSPFSTYSTYAVYSTGKNKDSNHSDGIWGRVG